MTADPLRKGATRASQIPPAVLAALSRGEQACLTLAECMAVDQALLLRTCFPDLPPAVHAQADAVCRLGILKRMSAMGRLLRDHLGDAGIARCRSHPADTVRGWACFMIGAPAGPGPDPRSPGERAEGAGTPPMPARVRPAGASLSDRLAAIRPLADDTHFGVREWAWLALRPHIAAQLQDAIAELTGWTAEPSGRLRRYACEALRPRGVWCAHLQPLKQAPWLALPMLTPLRADPDAYVQDSVANWLNDAAKDHPAWVRELCAKWEGEDGGAATQRICRRALRGLR